ncbi:unnamed protein product, partial [Rotaria sordida]
NLGLQQSFVDNSEVRRCLKTIGCLALIPEQYVILEFEKLQETSPDSLNSIRIIFLEIVLELIYICVLDFLDYF